MNILYTSPGKLIFANYGLLYNFPALTDLVPLGWHVPTDAEWHVLALRIDPAAIVALTESLIAGGPLKETGTLHWTSPNVGATDTSGFSARGGGHRRHDGVYEYMEGSNSFASSTANGPTAFYYRSLFANNTVMYRNFSWNRYGYSVRLLKNDAVDPGVMTDIDGNSYPTVKIGTQVWMKTNLKVVHFNTGANIPYVPSAVDWAAAPGAAYCMYEL